VPAPTATPAGGRIDVHQHLWPAELIEALRARRVPPRLDGWTLLLPGEPAYQVTPADHDAVARQAMEAGTELALVSLSNPLGLEDLPADEAAPLLDAWHRGAARLPEPFGAWAAVSRLEPDLAGLKECLSSGFAGLQVPATWLCTPDALERLAPVLAVAEGADRPVLVHPGPVPAHSAGRPGPEADLPGWWPAVVDYPAQLAAAWWSWHQAGRDLLPQLRIGFVAGAGLAPVQHERLHARGGTAGRVDPGVYVETSSYGPQAVDALVRARGIDGVVRGSDRPYAEPAELGMGAAAGLAIDRTNPQRFLFGGKG
jgi:hypothetical protein